MTTHVPRVRARLAIHAHRKVRGLLDGEYASVQTGRSMDFNDLREYVRGDDVKDIDWKASARTGTPLVKRYAAVRKHTVQLVVSTGRSMAAANDVGVSKRELAVFTAGVVGWLGVRHGDRVALAHGDAGGHHQLPPKGGELHLERCLGSAHDAISPDGAASDLTGLLSYVARTVRRRTILLVVCDDYELTSGLTSVLRRLVVQHEVLLVSIGDVDPTSGQLARGARVPSYDVDAGRALPDWLRGDATLQAQYADLVTDQHERLRSGLDAIGVVHEPVHDEASATNAVFRLLQRHRHARRR